jgi:hypothetical protein
MSDSINIPVTAVTMAFLGLALLAVGGVLVYFSLSSEWIVGPRIITPIGVALALLGLLVATSREG